MTPDELKKRTKDFALRTIRLVESLPKGKTADIIGRQLLRSGTSVGANYRSACRARSSADFISKMTIVEEEADESIYWMELLIEGGLLDKQRLNSNVIEAKELLAITVSSINTARQGRRS
jgi:four helix bundle protein